MIDEQEGLEEAYRKFEDLQSRISSLVMATIDRDFLPRASYAPYVKEESGSFYVYLSRLSDRTTDLIGNPVLSIMLIEDVSEATQIFARMRISYLCDAEIVDREDPAYERILDRFTQNFGNVVNLLRSLPDFVLFELKPRCGRFVMGFGQAYDLGGDRLDRLGHVGRDQLNQAQSNNNPDT